MSNNKKEALKTLSEREDIIITKADKRDGVVIIDVDDYVREAYRQLDNTEFHKKLPNDTTEITRTEVNTSIDEL